jgi:hypothetical protein
MSWRANFVVSRICCSDCRFRTIEVIEFPEGVIAQIKPSITEIIAPEQEAILHAG